MESDSGHGFDHVERLQLSGFCRAHSALGAAVCGTPAHPSGISHHKRPCRARRMPWSLEYADRSQPQRRCPLHSPWRLPPLLPTGLGPQVRHGLAPCAHAPPLQPFDRLAQRQLGARLASAHRLKPSGSAGSALSLGHARQIFYACGPMSANGCTHDFYFSTTPRRDAAQVLGHQLYFGRR